MPQQIQFIVFANMSISNIPTLSASDLTGTNVTLTADYFDVANDGLPMSSQLVTNKTLASGNNYYGYTTEESQDGTNLSTTPLPLNRNVARVEIADVFLDMAQSDYVSGSATFQFTGVKINNAANKAKISGVDTGAGHVSYNASDYSFYGDFSNAIEAVSQNSFTSETSPISAKPIKAYYYVLANTQISAADGAATTLVVEGKFSLSGAKMAGSDQVYDLASADATYPIVVGVTGMGTPVNIENNKVYRITLYVAGPGKTGTGGDRANFFVKCAVADWTAVNQSAVIK